MALVTQPDVLVVGGGWAGLTAAVRLTQRGARVLVLEARPRLGGRATAFEDQATGELVDNGQHVLFGCYSATFELLRDVGAIDNVRRETQLRVSMVDRNGRRSTLVCPQLPPPWHVLAGILEWDALSWADRFAALRVAAPLKLAIRQVAAEQESDGWRPSAATSSRSGARHALLAASPGETVENWLLRHGQTDRVRELLWRPLALAALNQPSERAAAPAFVRILAEMFGGGSDSAAVALPVKPLHLMYAEPARAFVENRGGRVRTGAAAKVGVSDEGILDVESAGERWRPRAVIAAVPWFALPTLFEGRAARLAPILDAAARTASSPIATVNLWFDRQVLEEPFLGLPGRTMQWVFDKRLVLGDSSSHLSLVSSGADAIVGMGNDPLIAMAHGELLEALPAVRSARLLRATVVRERQATFSLAPGQPARPSTDPGVRGLYLAGDWIDTGLPATIEGAVRSGSRAAAAALAHLS
jgi:predicted NAD/FAD-binding protein